MTQALYEKKKIIKVWTQIKLKNIVQIHFMFLTLIL
jgi:hypothetical protein